MVQFGETEFGRLYTKIFDWIDNKDLLFSGAISGHKLDDLDEWLFKLYQVPFKRSSRIYINYGLFNERIRDGSVQLFDLDSPRALTLFKVKMVQRRMHKGRMRFGNTNQVTDNSGATEAACY
jgi:hypothetical protein